MSKDVLEVAYIHEEDGKPYKHKFEKSGTRLKTMPDGSIKIYNPQYKLWEDF